MLANATSIKDILIKEPKLQVELEVKGIEKERFRKLSEYDFVCLLKQHGLVQSYK